jgi:hypothetical protein
MLERGVEQRDSPASSPLAPPNASRFGKHGTALFEFGSTDPNAGRNIRAEAAAKFFPTGRQRPDMHNLVPELKGFHDLTYDFGGNLILPPSGHLALTGKVGRKSRRILSHRRGLYLVNKPFCVRNESTDKSLQPNFGSRDAYDQCAPLVYSYLARQDEQVFHPIFPGFPGPKARLSASSGQQDVGVRRRAQRRGALIRQYCRFVRRRAARPAAIPKRSQRVA